MGMGMGMGWEWGGGGAGWDGAGWGGSGGGRSGGADAGGHVPGVHRRPRLRLRPLTPASPGGLSGPVPDPDRMLGPAHGRERGPGAYSDPGGACVMEALRSKRCFNLPTHCNSDVSLQAIRFVTSAWMFQKL